MLFLFSEHQAMTDIILTTDRILFFCFFGGEPAAASVFLGLRKHFTFSESNIGAPCPDKRPPGNPLPPSTFSLCRLGFQAQ